MHGMVQCKAFDWKWRLADRCWDCYNIVLHAPFFGNVVLHAPSFGNIVLHAFSMATVRCMHLPWQQYVACTFLGNALTTTTCSVHYMHGLLSG